MEENEAWAIQIRAQQGVAAGNVRRLKERIEHLTTFKVNCLITSHDAQHTCKADNLQGQNFQESIAA